MPTLPLLRPASRRLVVAFVASLVGAGIRAASAASLPPAAASATASTVAPLPPADAPPMPLEDIRAGQAGTVWTVFQGTRPEPFAVTVTGIVRNALGPGRSIILCRMTDPRVQDMGAVAGMSGSPLYIGGRLAGALSYQVQRFETVRYAGFTPVEDLLDVAGRVEPGAQASPGAEVPGMPAPDGPYRPLKPMLALGGLSPDVARLFASRFEALGFACDGLAGDGEGGDEADADGTGPGGTGAAQPESQRRLGPGDAAAVALSVGDLTIGAVGTVTQVSGNRVVAFGHPMVGLGDVDLPLCSASVVAILPSTLESTKIANIGPVIGRITEDRLSGVSGTLGARAGLIEVGVTVRREQGPPRVLRFKVIRQELLTPSIVAAGLTQAILASNDAGLSRGFRLEEKLAFPKDGTLSTDSLYAGPQAFALGLSEFVQGLAADLLNPYERTFPDRIDFTATPLPDNPAVLLERFTLSRTQARGGDTVVATLGWRDYQGADHTESIPIPIDPAWTGRSVEIVAAPGRTLDELVGRSRQPSPGQVRSFAAYLDLLRQARPADGISVAVIEQTDLFSDQADTTAEMPASIERIARAEDEGRFRDRRAFVPLWETHLLPGRLAGTVLRRPLDIVN